MNIHADKTQENKTLSVSNEASQKKRGDEPSFQFADNRADAAAQHEMRDMINSSPKAQKAAQFQSMANNYSAQQHQSIEKKENNTGLPDNLKSGLEYLSGYSLDDINVHYNSDKPAQLHAHAYAQGNDIHLASGQEKHLPHEAWHVVQQKQGRVKPTIQMKGKVNINDDVALEKEADTMGALANKEQSNKLEQAPPGKKGNPQFEVSQAVLMPVDETFLRGYFQARVKSIIFLFEATGHGVSGAMATQIRAQLAHIQANAIANNDYLTQAINYVDTQLMVGVNVLVSSLQQKSISYQTDPAFKKHQWDYLMPMMAHVQEARVLGHAMLSHTKTLVYGQINNADQWLRDPDVALELFRRLHGSIQGLLKFANVKKGNHVPKGKDDPFKIEDGLDLMNSVGRLSMMIADPDFLPYWDTRALPHNWTSDQFLDQRLERPGVTREHIEHTKANLLEARNERREVDQSESTRNPESNDRTDFRYEIDVPTTGGHNVNMFNSGALRLEFSDAREILNKINPGAKNEDLSYENIVAYLKYMEGSQLNTQMREVFQHMGAADAFLRELAVLLVGIEGSQNNMMMMHGPMVMDLAAQGKIGWDEALFTGERRPTLENMPYFVYASDATQKGTDKDSAGPMERQTELLRSGKFSEQDLDTEDQIIKAAEQEKAFKKAKQERDNLIFAKRREAKADLAKQYKATMDAELLSVGDDKAKQIEIRQKYAAIIKEQVQKIESEYVNKLDDLPEEPTFEANQQDKRSTGYHTFKDVYMQQQFELQRIFLETFFPHIFTLDFGEGNTGKVNFIAFVQRLMEHYMIYRFVGSGEKADRVHARWASVRGKAISPGKTSRSFEDDSLSADDSQHDEEGPTVEMDAEALAHRIQPGVALRFEYINNRVDCRAVVLTVDQARATSVAGQLEPLQIEEGASTAITLASVFKTIGGDSLEKVRAPHVVVQVVEMLNHNTGDVIVGGQGNAYAHDYIPNVVGSIFSLTERSIIS